VCIQGPAFSARAESLLYRSWGVSVIGMTNLPEARLAREAEMCYATLALVTDFDCWHQTEEEVSAELILENLKQNAATAQEIIRALLPLLPAGRSCECAHALQKALVTPPDRIPEAARRRLDILLPPYIE
jgi:5'-methylthioadenosine phosphorylase